MKSNLVSIVPFPKPIVSSTGVDIVALGTMIGGMLVYALMGEKGAPRPSQGSGDEQDYRALLVGGVTLGFISVSNENPLKPEFLALTADIKTKLTELEIAAYEQWRPKINSILASVAREMLDTRSISIPFAQMRLLHYKGEAMFEPSLLHAFRVVAKLMDCACAHTEAMRATWLTEEN